MTRVIEGNLVSEGSRFAIIVARFNEFITSKLLGGCKDTLLRHGVDEEMVDIIYCPGAFEIPFVAKQAALTGQYDAIICLGAVIRGSTPHFDYVCGECAKGISRVSLDTNVPCIFGVLTTNSIEQAVERAGTKAGNKGCDVAVTAIEMVNLTRQINKKPLARSLSSSK